MVLSSILLKCLTILSLTVTYMLTSNEWLLDPGLSNKGMKCKFNGEHKATRTTEEEITHTMLYGKGRNGILYWTLLFIYNCFIYIHVYILYNC